MHIVYLAHGMIPSHSANSINIVKMCAAFVRNGHQVRLLIPERPGRSAEIKDIFQYYGVDREFTVQVLPWGQYPGRSYCYAARAALAAKRARVDCVYTRFLTGAVATTLNGINTIFEGHAPARDQGLFAAWLLRVAAMRPALRRLVTISAALRDDYGRYIPRLKSRLLVAHDGADLFPQKKASSSDADTKFLRVGYVGQLYPGKGMEVISGLLPLCPWAYFHVVGGNPADIERWQSATRDFRNIQFHGFVPPREVPDYLAGFDVLVAPYQRVVSVFGGGGNVAQWMSPLKLFEYMAAAKAIVCSDLPVLREIFVEGKTALLCDPDDLGAWQAALTSLRDNKRLRIDLGLNARELLEYRYTWTARAAHVLDGIGLT